MMTEEENDEHGSEECPNYAECPYCEAAFHICDLFPEAGYGGIVETLCHRCFNVFEVSEEVQIIYEVMESKPRNGSKD